jgi:hypothetical protein
MHKTSKKLVAAAAAVLLVSGLAACDGSGILAPPPGLPHAVAARSCGAADAPTIAIYLTNKEVESLPLDAPFLRISISGTLQQLAGNSWRMDGEHYDDWAALHRTPTTAEMATSGVVSVFEVTADSAITGDVLLEFVDGSTIKGGFKARWIPQPQSFCG